MFAENLTQKRQETVEALLDELLSIVKDSEVDMEQRLKAAKIIDGISDTMVHAQLLDRKVESDEDSNRRLVDQMRDLKKDSNG